MPAAVSEKKFADARTFIDHLIHDADRDCLFRGQANSEWPLTPSAWRGDRLTSLRARIKNSLGEKWPNYLTYLNVDGPAAVAERFLDDASDDSIARVRDLVIWLVAEGAIVNAFSRNCDRVALTVPDLLVAGRTSLLTESRTFVGTRPRSKLTFREVPIYELNAAHALAQHMKLPTRLLDFTESPLKAAYFAMMETLPLMLSVAPKYISVWSAKPPSLDVQTFNSLLLKGDETKIIRILRSQIPYLHAQDGLFVSCNASSNSYFLANGQWPSLENMMHDWTLEKLLLPTSESANLEYCLNKLGINSTTMMPSYQQAAADTAKHCGL